MLPPTVLMRNSALVFSVTLCFTLVACDSGNTAPKADPAAEARAKEAEDKKKRVEAKRLEREAGVKEKADAEAKHKEAIAAMLVLPEKMPKKLGKACKAASDAQDAFMLRHYEGEAVEKWNAAKSTQLQKAVAECTKVGNIEVAACQANALTIAPTELKKALPDLLRGCIEKFGKAPEGGAPPPPK